MIPWSQYKHKSAIIIHNIQLIKNIHRAVTMRTYTPQHHTDK